MPWCFTVGARHSDLKRSPVLVLTIMRSLPGVPNHLNGASSENINMAHSSSVHSMYFLQKASLSYIFFFVNRGIFALFLEGRWVLNSLLRTVCDDAFMPINFYYCRESIRELRPDKMTILLIIWDFWPPSSFFADEDVVSFQDLLIF